MQVGPEVCQASRPTVSWVASVASPVPVDPSSVSHQVDLSMTATCAAPQISISRMAVLAGLARIVVQLPLACARRFRGVAHSQGGYEMGVSRERRKEREVGREKERAVCHGMATKTPTLSCLDSG